MSADRPDEKFAFAVVGKVLGVTVEEYDVLGRRAAVDALLHYPDGRIAALEVSSLGPPEEARVMEHPRQVELQAHDRWAFPVLDDLGSTRLQPAEFPTARRGGAALRGLRLHQPQERGQDEHGCC
ncbi:hypothetical protein [Lentzea sp. CA-135723]|uniref:hypothetical protein n=1 Tax=Lentzea sp. CA-135723 TaxID=3239950 RepID=UPI003D8B8B78